MTRRIPVIADVDTGMDDALALLYLAVHDGVDLVAVTCVDGNVPVDTVVTNTKRILLAAGRDDVPIGRGAERPFIEPSRHARGFHGEDGLGGLFDGPDFSTGTAALDLLRRALTASAEPVTLVALAPLTTIALLLRGYPEVSSRIERIVVMGGSIGPGNATAVAEFNAWHDPEAFDIVLRSGVPVTMYGLDVFSAATVDPDSCVGSSPAATATRSLLAAIAQRDATAPGADARVCLGDAGAACLAVRPELGTVRRLPVTVALSGEARGQTMVDLRTRHGEDTEHAVAVESTVVTVVTAIDAAAVGEEFARTVCGSLV